jgi:hypothetical protein
MGLLIERVTVLTIRRYRRKRLAFVFSAQGVVPDLTLIEQHASLEPARQLWSKVRKCLC